MKVLDDRALVHVAEYFRALSEPLRLKILNTLGDRPHNVGELTELLECSQANVSKHLATLTRLGFVALRARRSCWAPRPNGPLAAANARPREALTAGRAPYLAGLGSSMASWCCIIWPIIISIMLMRPCMA